MAIIGSPVVPENTPNIIVDGGINQTFAQSANYAGEAVTTAQEAIESLTNYVAGLAPLELLPDFTDPEFVRYILTTGERPQAPTIDFPDLIIPDLNTPIPPFNYFDSLFASDLREALKTKLEDGVANGGSGLGADVEASIVARNELRDLQDLQDRLDAAGAEWSETDAGDLGLPDGKLLAMRRRLHQTYLAGRQTASNDIAVKMAELARQQEEVYLREGNQLENIMETKHTADQGRALEAAKVEPEIVLKGYEIAMTRVKTMVEVYNALASRANAEAQIFKAQMDGYVADSEIGAKELAASTQKYDSDVKAAAARSESAWRTDSNQVDQIKNYISLRTDAMKTIMQVMSSLAAAALTSVSASISMGVSQSSSFSESTTASSSTVYQNYNDVNAE